MWPFYEYDPIYGNVVERLGFLAELLGRGGDPNIYVDDFSSTVWGVFLKQMWCQNTRPTGPATAYELTEKALLEHGANLWAMTTKAFLENGANACEISYPETHVQLVGLGSLKGQPALENESPIYQASYTDFVFSKEVTALSVIRHCLSDTLCFGDLEKICMAKGSCSASEVTLIGLNHDSYRAYRITKQQYKNIIAAFDGYGPSGRSEKVPIPTRLEWARRIAKLYDEVPKGCENSDSQEPSDEETRSETNREILPRKSLWERRKAAILMGLDE